MGSDSPPETPELQARRLAEALDVIEAQLDTLRPAASPSIVAKALAEPVRAFDAAAKEALR